jgi:hypothetical protein
MNQNLREFKRSSFLVIIVIAAFRPRRVDVESGMKIVCTTEKSVLEY